MSDVGRKCDELETLLSQALAGVSIRGGEGRKEEIFRKLDEVAKRRIPQIDMTRGNFVCR